jgi:hypothetical protein
MVLFAPTRITLRGNRSLTGNNQPLIVVDGAIFNNDLSTMNTEDILDVKYPERFEVRQLSMVLMLRTVSLSLTRKEEQRQAKCEFFFTPSR